jgi:hypothetical protein
VEGHPTPYGSGRIGIVHEHRKHPVISPALLKKITEDFVSGIHAFAEQFKIPVVNFEAHERKEEVARKHLARFKGDEGVVMIGVAQEMVSGFRVYQ